MKKILFVVMLLVGCTAQQAKTATDVAVKVTTELCAEEASDPNEPDFVKLACQVEGGLAHVFLPRTEWRAMKAAAAKK